MCINDRVCRFHGDVLGVAFWFRILVCVMLGGRSCASARESVLHLIVVFVVVFVFCACVIDDDDAYAFVSALVMLQYVVRRRTSFGAKIAAIRPHALRSCVCLGALDHACFCCADVADVCG